MPETDLNTDGRAPGTQAGRLIEVIELVVSSGTGVGPREVSRNLAIPASTASRALTSLTALSVLRRTAEGQYTSGPRLLRIAHEVLANSNLRVVALEQMEQLHDYSQDTILLGELTEDRRSVVFIESLHSSRALSYRVDLGRPYELTRGATGLAILAFLPDDVRSSLLNDADAHDLEDALALIRDRTVAVSHGQRVEGAVGIAAPIFGTSGVVGDICITMPEQRAARVDIADLSSRVVAAARTITDSLGGDWPPRSRLDRAGG